MKKIFKSFSVLFLFLIVFACQDVLNEEPITSFSEEQIFSTEDGVESAVNGLYYTFASGGYHGSSWHALINPLSGKFWSNQGASRDATSLNCTPINTWLTRLWPAMYQTVNVSNTIIENLEDSTLENRDVALGQAYFIRGVVYFEMVQIWGGVPLKLTPASIETLHTPRSEKVDVYNQIITDLESAKELLPDFGDYRPERPAKYAANVYLAKLYMKMAGEDDGNASYWQNAYNELVPVIGKYNLTATYAELFDIDNENTQESIFEVQYGANGAIRTTDVIRLYTPKNSAFVSAAVPTFGRVTANKEVYDQHLTQYPGDPRIDATFIYDSYEKSNGGTQTVYPTRATGNFGYPFIRKYLDPDYNGTATNRNYIALRYADVLLMMAEIENEINGPGDAYQYVNELLARARNTESGTTTEPADWSGMSPDQFRTRIMRERQYEMLAEGQQWTDTRRRGYEYFLDEVVELHNSTPTLDSNKDFIYPISIKNMLLPIPSGELSTNQAMSPADQNPGY